jgi:23S rRNA maturation-related 3'-5' exoribonuclease YhaM
MVKRQKMEQLRAGVRKCLPELRQITNEKLRDKVVEAWALALSESEFGTIDDIPAQGAPEHPLFKKGKGTQSGHFRGVAKIAQGIADGLQGIHPDVKIDRDLLWACALCHDLGKAYEMSPRNQARWKRDVAAHGYPAIRHPGYGIHVAIVAGLPEVVAQTAGYHSMEGEWVRRSLLTMIVHYADYAYWHLVDRAGLLVASMYPK